MGEILFAVILASVLAAGSLEKEDKIWCVKSIVIFVVVSLAFGGGAIASNSSTSTDTERLRILIQMGFGLSIGLVYCVLYADKLRNRKFPLAAGASVLLISAGWVILMFDLLGWLDKVGK